MAIVSCSGLLMLFLGLLFSFLNVAAAQSIGVCYGMNGSDLPSKPEVINMYKTHNIGRMRLYDPNPDALNALKGSNIEVILGLPNDQLQKIASNAQEAATWVQNNVKNFYPDVKIKYIAVSNEVIPGNLANFVLPAMRNINIALDSGLEAQIKVSTSVATSVLDKSSYPPSHGVFQAEALRTLGPIVQFLSNTLAPLLVNVYPYISYIDNMATIKLPYALFNPSDVVNDASYQYTNLFDAIVDTIHVALEKAGGPTVRVVVSESGWPSAGNVQATIDNARTYNQNLIKHVKNGTPRKIGALETYIFAMFNEDGKDISGPLGEAERHFGLFNPNKSPAYAIDFS